MWIEKIQDYCRQYNIPIEYFPELISDPKVVPMIRGKAFEFSVLIALRYLLDSKNWQIEKLNINAQSTIPDEDLTITHIPTGKNFTIECKLSAKEKYDLIPKYGLFKIQVKCMRSRTLGEEKVKTLAPLWGLSESILKVHNDQYLPKDFDLLVTSIGNAFYTTESSSGNYIWNPNKSAIDFLQSQNPLLKLDNPNELKDFAFNQMYVARSSDLAVSEKNQIKCSRKKCSHQANCGFIPNYPNIFFDLSTLKVLHPWYPLDQCLELLEKMVNS